VDNLTRFERRIILSQAENDLELKVVLEQGSCRVFGVNASFKIANYFIFKRFDIYSVWLQNWKFHLRAKSSLVNYDSKPSLTFLVLNFYFVFIQVET
jgi:hypothetical protein